MATLHDKITTNRLKNRTDYISPTEAFESIQKVSRKKKRLQKFLLSHSLRQKNRGNPQILYFFRLRRIFEGERKVQRSLPIIKFLRPTKEEDSGTVKNYSKYFPTFFHNFHFHGKSGEKREQGSSLF